MMQELLQNIPVTANIDLHAPLALNETSEEEVRFHYRKYFFLIISRADRNIPVVSLQILCVDSGTE